MTVTRQTIYRCDPCGKEVAGRPQLRTIHLSWGQRERYNSDRPGIKADFCIDCLTALATDAASYFGEQGKKTIEAIYSSPKKKKR